MKLAGETANWAESALLLTILETTRLDDPVLETTSVFCENEPTKVESMDREAGVTDIAGLGGGGAGVVDFPTPLNATVVGLPAAL